MNADIIFLDVGGIILEINWAYSLEPLGFMTNSSQKEVINKISEWEVLHSFEKGHIEPSLFFKKLKDILEIDIETTLLMDTWNRLIAGPLPNSDKIFERYSAKFLFVLYRIQIYLIIHTKFLSFPF